MNQEIPPPLPLEFKDRKTSLTFFGVLTILAGLLCALLVAFMFFAQKTSSHTHGASQHPGAFIMPAFIYGGLAVAFIWLGIGSIMARRWARALLLIMSWSTLILGLVMLAFLAAMSGTFLASMQAAQPSGHKLPEAAQWIILFTTGIVFGVLFVIFPAIWAFFYGSKSVKATCERRDPVECWTDRCPLSVLAASLFMAFSAISVLLTSFSLHGVIPFFGTYLAGLPGILLYLLISAFWFYCAWAFYKLDSRGWWIGIVGVCIFPISAAITYYQHGIMEFYKLAGYSGEELARLQQVSFLNGNNLVWFTLASVLPWLGCLLFVKKYFRD